MFTGIVEELGEVVALRLAPSGEAARLTVRGPRVVADATAGASIAVDGCCLTVTAHDGETFSADVMAETLRRTTVGGLRPGDPVNLERAVRADARLGGHLVQGHVDATGAIVARSPGEGCEVVTISLPPDRLGQVVAQGSIAVDGVSLTVVDPGSADDPVLTVSLIPETLARTTLGRKRPGAPVNLELDVLGKYVARYVERLLELGGHA
ncbi:MAG: riboflavin synthase [Frankiaceae bacterium]